MDPENYPALRQSAAQAGPSRGRPGGWCGARKVASLREERTEAPSGLTSSEMPEKASVPGMASTALLRASRSAAQAEAGAGSGPGFALPGAGGRRWSGASAEPPSAPRLPRIACEVAAEHPAIGFRQPTQRFRASPGLPRASFRSPLAPRGAGAPVCSRWTRDRGLRLISASRSARAPRRSHGGRGRQGPVCGPVCGGGPRP